MAAQKRIEITYWKLKDLAPDPRNPRRNDLAVGPVAESIRQFGMRVPLVIDKKGNIISGHTRYKACVMLGLEDVPCVTADQLTLKQQRAFQLADNKTGELAQWDPAMLATEMESLASVFDVSKLGFDLAVGNGKNTGNNPPSVGAGGMNDGMVVCPRCGRRFIPGSGAVHDEDDYPFPDDGGDAF